MLDWFCQLKQAVLGFCALDSSFRWCCCEMGVFYLECRTEVMGEYCRYARVGSLIMLLHDPSDIFLEAAKLLNYAGLELPSVAAFAGLLCSWLALRLVLLPFWVIRSCMWVSDLLLTYFTYLSGPTQLHTQASSPLSNALLLQLLLRLVLPQSWVKRSRMRAA